MPLQVLDEQLRFVPGLLFVVLLNGQEHLTSELLEFQIHLILLLDLAVPKPPGLGLQLGLELRLVRCQQIDDELLLLDYQISPICSASRVSSPLTLLEILHSADRSLERPLDRDLLWRERDRVRLLLDLERPRGILKIKIRLSNL